jgi:hypothetical protein
MSMPLTLAFGNPNDEQVSLYFLDRLMVMTTQAVSGNRYEVDVKVGDTYVIHCGQDDTYTVRAIFSVDLNDYLIVSGEQGAKVVELSQIIEIMDLDGELECSWIKPA